MQLNYLIFPTENGDKIVYVLNYFYWSQTIDNKCNTK